MYPHGARPPLTPSASRPRFEPIPRSLPVPLHVTSSRKVHLSGDGIINIIQEISFYADGGVKSLAGKQLKEVHCHPDAQTRSRFAAETNARVFVGQSMIRMHIQTAIRPNSSESLDIAEVLHFADNQDALVVPIAFEATLEHQEGQYPAVEFELQSAIVVALKQRIQKYPGEQYKVLQAIELRANETENRPTQELARKSTITQPMTESSQFRERIFVGTDMLRVDRDIIFVCDRQTLSLSERREYIPAYPTAPRRRSASLTQSVPRVRNTPDKSRSRSQSLSSTDDAPQTANCRTANEDFPTATSPYSLHENESNSRIPPFSNTPRTAREASPTNSSNPDRTSRSKRKKWTVNSVASKADATTPERNDRARTMRSLSTARNLSLSPITQRSSNQNIKTARSRSPHNGEISGIHAIPIVPNIELGPHGESQLVEGMEVLKVAAPTDSLVRTCLDGCSPPRSSSNCSTAGVIPTSASSNNYASQSPPFSSPRPMPAHSDSSAPSSRPCTPMRTARNASPCLQRAPSSAALDKRRGLFGYGTRPVTTPTRSARFSPAASPAMKTCIDELSPMRKAQRVYISPVHTAVRVSTPRSRGNSRNSQKERSHGEDKRMAANARLSGADRSSKTNLATARNLFGTVPSNERLVTARTPKDRSVGCTKSPAVRTAVSPARSLKTARDESPFNGRGCPGRGPSEQSPSSAVTTGREQWPMSRVPRQLFGDVLTTPPCAVKTAESSPFAPAQEGSASALYYSGEKIEEPKTARERSYRDSTVTARSPMQSLKTARNTPCEKRARDSRASPCSLPTARSGRSPALLTARQSPYGNATARETCCPAVLRTASPYENNVVTAREDRSPAHSIKTARESPYERKARPTSVSPARGLPTARGNTDRSPALLTARQPPYDKSARSPALNTAVLSPYEQNVLTARAARSPVVSPMKTAARERSERTARSPADGTRTAAEYGRSPVLPTARGHSTDAPRSLYLSPLMASENAAVLAQHRQQPDDGSYKQVVTARAVSPYRQPRDLASPLRPTMTAREATSPHMMTARDGDNSTKSCISGGTDTNARWTARSAHSPMVVTSRDLSASPVRTARSGYAAPTTTPTRVQPEVMQQLSRHSSPPRTAIYGGGAEDVMATSRTQSPATRSAASNAITPKMARELYANLDSPATAREQRQSPYSLRTGRDRSRGFCATSPMNLKTAREQRTASKSPAARRRSALPRTPEHNTMPDSQARQEDSYSEQSQLTFQKTPSGYTQKPTHASELMTGQQRTPTKTDNNTVYYSARQTTPSRTLRPDDVTLTRRTPKRDYSQHGGLQSARSPAVKTAVNCTTPNKKMEEPKCSLKTGCQATHAPRVIPAGPDSDKDEPRTATSARDKTPERSVRTAHGPVRSTTPSKPLYDMRTPRTARASGASPASLLRSPAPSSHMITAMSPDAASNSDNSNEDMITARRNVRSVSSPRPTTARHRDWAAAAAPMVAATAKPGVIVRANQVDGKIHVEVCLSFKLNTTGTIRVRGEMARALHPRTVTVNGQQIWSDSSRQ